ncbi:hypothetical protein RRF57_007898 [Xylaria bambusicola]|uniref:Uncharacterized protein n=1 Tax=Xylaria bambusicola TaxID=326684 RepID=A0AAN7UR72_9PEZI
MNKISTPAHNKCLIGPYRRQKERRIFGVPLAGNNIRQRKLDTDGEDDCSLHDPCQYAVYRSKVRRGDGFALVHASD